VNPNNRQATFYQAGFSLVEIMVGLVIGLLATLVITQVFSVFEGQKRTTTGAADAQTNGSIALYNMQRELQMAGYGLLPTGEATVADSAIECTALTIDAATGIGDISPVTITDGGAAGASDSITLRYSTSDTGGIPYSITGVGADVNVNNNMGCQIGDIALTISGNTCFLTSVTGLSAPPPPAPASAPAATITLQDINGAVTGASIACLGAWREITYRVSGGNQERCDLAAAIANGGNCNLVTPNTDFVPSVVGIVNIQAQYGIGDPAAANPNRVVQWVNATGAWAAPAAADRNRIKAVRVAVVARNSLMEKEDVNLSYGGKACDSLVSDAPTGVCSWSGTSASPDIASPAPAIDLSGDPDWLRYRYRVFETIIPLRNVIWSKSTL
jgi:type IV pilus assembly protein PilW